MRVLLTLPPDIYRLEIYAVTGMNVPPLGLAYIAAVLERAGHKVRIVDTPTLKMDSSRWIREVKSWSPDLIGISLLTPTAPRGYASIKAVREEMPDVTVVVGGPHPTFMYEEALDHGAHVVVMGEGELTMQELVNVLEAHGLDHEKLREIRGIAFRRGNGETVVTPPRTPLTDLDELPWPARHLLPMEKYTLFGRRMRVAHVMASRGCPYGCIYCTTSHFWGRRIRFRSPGNVADEVEHLVDRYKVKYIVFADDELTAGRKFVYEFIRLMREKGIDIQFACASRVDHVTKDYLEFLYENGCTVIYFGVESASQDTLNRIGKRISIEQVRRVFEWKKQLGGVVVASFMLGFPWETLNDMRDTIEFAIRLDPDYAQFTLATPYPGTPLYRYAVENGLIEDWNWEHYTTMRPVMRGFNFTREQLGKILKRAYRRFFLRPRFLWREFRRGRLRDVVGILAREALNVLRESIPVPPRLR